MQKAIRLTVVFLVALLSVSAHTQRVFKGSEGYKAPQFTVSNAAGTVSLASLKGEYVLVNFWSTADAASRIAAFDYDRFFSTTASRIRLISVNLDESSDIFQAAVHADSLNASMQYHADEPSADDLIRDYALSGVLTSFLIDPQGRIIALDPTVDELRKV